MHSNWLLTFQISMQPGIRALESHCTNVTENLFNLQHIPMHPIYNDQRVAGDIMLKTCDETKEEVFSWQTLEVSLDMSVTKCFKLWKEESCTPRIADIDDDQEDSFIKGPQHVHNTCARRRSRRGTLSKMASFITPLTIVDQFGIKISGFTPSYEALTEEEKKG